MLLIIFKALKNSMPQYIQSLSNIRENKKNLRGNNKLVLPVAEDHDLWAQINLVHCC